VFNEWIKIAEFSGTFNLIGYNYQTPLASVYFEVNGKSKKDEIREPSLKKITNSIDHLKANEYTYIRDIWSENCKKGADDLLTLTIKIWEDIEKKAISNPFFSSLTEVGLENSHTQIGYDLKATGWSIYEGAEYYLQKKTNHLNHGFTKTVFLR
jgi:hypothetical protein